jgi:hypothetical protein
MVAQSIQRQLRIVVFGWKALLTGLVPRLGTTVKSRRHRGLNDGGGGVPSLEEFNARVEDPTRDDPDAAQN